MYLNVRLVFSVRSRDGLLLGTVLCAMSLRLLSAVTLKRNGTDTRHLESVPRRHVVKRISHSAAILPRKRNTRFR